MRSASHPRNRGRKGEQIVGGKVSLATHHVKTDSLDCTTQHAVAGCGLVSVLLLTFSPLASNRVGAGPQPRGNPRFPLVEGNCCPNSQPFTYLVRTRRVLTPGYRFAPLGLCPIRRLGLSWPPARPHLA